MADTSHMGLFGRVDRVDRKLGPEGLYGSAISGRVLKDAGKVDRTICFRTEPGQLPARSTRADTQLE